MNRVTRLETAFQALAAVFIIVAAVSTLWRPSVPTNEIPVAGLNSELPAHVPHATIDRAAAQAVVNANVFSSSRKAPVARYDPLETTAEPAAQQSPDYTSAEASASADGERVPQLFGTVVGPGGSSALMRLDPSTPGAQLYRQGDRGGAFRVVKINESSVVLSGPQGQIVVRLIPPEGPTS